MRRLHRSLLLVLLLAGVSSGCGIVTPTGSTTVVDAIQSVDGEHFVFLLDVSPATRVIHVDPARWVADDGEPNGYRIEDPNVRPFDLPVADDAVIEVFRSTGDPATAAEVTVAELADWLVGLGDPSIEAAFNVTVAGGEVVEMRFVYRP